MKKTLRHMGTILFLALLVKGFSFAQAAVTNLSVSEADALLKSKLNDPNFIIIDVRTADEFNNSKGHILRSVNIDWYDAPGFVTAVNKYDKNKTFFVYCQSGGRSGAATAKMVNEMGFKNVYNLASGFNAWDSQGKETSARITGNDVFANQVELKIFPNPSLGIFKLQSTAQYGTLEVLDIIGNKIETISINSPETIIDLNHLVAGTYMLRITQGETVSMKRIFKK